MALERSGVQEDWTSLPAVSFCPDPVFIIGSPRSGTSALAWALHHHPAFWTSKETDFLQPLFGHGQAGDVFEQAGSSERSWLHYNEVGQAEFSSYLGLGINALITSRSEGKRWVDQTPSYTLFADDLVDLFPGARFLHIARDGRAAVNSMVHFGQGIGKQLSDEGHLPHWATGFRQACETWVGFCRTALELGAGQPDRVLLVHNEDLASEPADGFRRILDFLEEEDHPGPANFFASSRINSSFAPIQWGDPSTPARTAGSLAPRNRGEEAWHSWNTGQRSLFTTLAAGLMAELGYASDSTGVLE
jgi:Sulfotransferase family